MYSTMTGLKLLCKDIRLHNTESTDKQDQMYAFTRWTGGGWGGEGGHGGAQDQKQIGGEKLSYMHRGNSFAILLSLGI